MPKNLEKTLLDHPDLLQKYKDRDVTVADLAAALGYKENYVTVTLSRMGVKREKDDDSIYAQRLRNKRLVRARRAYHNYLIEQVSNKHMSVEDAAEAAGVSTRTIYRQLAKKE